MSFRNEKNVRVKQAAKEEAVIIISNWKKARKRMQIYRFCLKTALIISVVALLSYGYYRMDNSVPSVIRVRAGQESLNLGIPARATVMRASEQGQSNIPEGAVTIDLSAPLLLQTGEASTSYRMEVKLFGILPFKEVGIQVIEDEQLIPVGAPIGIYMETDGVLVVGTGNFRGSDGKTECPAKNVLKSGDYIHAVNGEPIADKNAFIQAIEGCGGNAVSLLVERGEKRVNLTVTPKQNEAGSYKIGAWVRDSAQGVGTMTFIDGSGNFGALGHGINDVDTNTLMNLEEGTLYRTEIIAIKRGENGNPGEMTGMITYSDDRILGEITCNSTQGIFGHCNERAMGLIKEKPLPIGLKQEIRKGPAQILCTIGEEPAYFDVEITDIHLDHDNVNRGIELTVTDPELLDLTGGIVQGMSGAPIIQDGKFIGAVTHVLIQDSRRGYGIFIENMLEQ